MTNIRPGQHDHRIIIDDDIKISLMDRAISVTHGKYARINFDKCRILLHHYVIGQPLYGCVIDHINGNGLDNRRMNLRLASKSENGRNRIKLPSNNTSGYIGVSWSKHDKCWDVRMRVGPNYLYLGGYKDIDLAVKARRNAELKYYGEFASKLNAGHHAQS